MKGTRDLGGVLAVSVMEHHGYAAWRARRRVGWRSTASGSLEGSPREGNHRLDADLAPAVVAGVNIGERQERDGGAMPGRRP